MHVKGVEQIVVTRGACDVGSSSSRFQDLHDVVLKVFVLEVDEGLELPLLSQDDEELPQTVPTSRWIRVRHQRVVRVLRVERRDLEFSWDVFETNGYAS